MIKKLITFIIKNHKINKDAKESFDRNFCNGKL